MKTKSSLLPEVIYSSYQWFQVLDTLAELILEAILENSSMLEYYAGQLLVFQHTHKRKAISLEHKWRASLSKLTSFIARPSMELFLDINLDRGYTQSMIFNFLTLMEGYPQTVQRCFVKPLKKRSLNLYDELDSYHARIGAKHKRDILQVVLHISYLFREYLKIRDQIMMNYYAYISNKATYETSKYGVTTSYDKEDLHQNYYMATNRAINHFNKDKGTFKSYLDLWLKKVFLQGFHSWNKGNPADLNESSFMLLNSEQSWASEKLTEQPPLTKEQLSTLAGMLDPSGYLSASLGLTHAPDDVNHRRKTVNN